MSEERLSGVPQAGAPDTAAPPATQETPASDVGAANGHNNDRPATATPVAAQEPGGAAADETPAPDGPAVPAPAPRAEAEGEDLRPREIVRRLDDYIIGQAAAKRAVAVALRNRVRRRRIPDDMRDEVLPKNILMIGPTGVGKTEIARRLARLTRSPFIKVEATKFTEVGYVGRDVEAIVRDLLEQTITEVHDARIAEVEDRARAAAHERILDVLVAAEQREDGARRSRTLTAGDEPASTDGGGSPPSDAPAAGPGTEAAAAGDDEAARRRRRALRRRLRKMLEERRLEGREIEIEVEEPFQPAFEGFSGTGLEEVGVSLSDFFSQLAPVRRRIKRMSVADARTVLVDEETDRLIDMDRVYDDAIRAVEEGGIVFIDEVDKIAGRGTEHGPDVSGEGVQRDLLPILEGSTVHTRYGAVHTDHILFIAAGAFTAARPSDLIPEFQGRFPIRVELSALTEEDLQRILVEPGNALTKQYASLLRVEDVTLEFAPDGLAELAHQAFTVNEQDENLGARRLFTILERVLEDVSFSAEDHAGTTVTIDRGYVRARLADLVRNEDLRRYVL